MFSPLALIFALGMLPQTMVPQTNLPKSLPPNCPADRPVDELMAEIRTQSKKQLRNKNPLPDEICIYGWCNRVKRPHSTRQPEIRLNDSGKSDNQDSATSNQKASSGKNAATVRTRRYCSDRLFVHFASKNNSRRRCIVESVR